MKIIDLFIALSVLGLINSAGITATTITGINSPAIGRVGANSIKFAITKGDITGAANIIYLSTSALTPTTDTDPKYPIATAPGSNDEELTASFTISTPGTYNVFIYDGSNSILQKKNTANISIVIAEAAPAATIITKIEATNPEANKAIKYKFTLADPGLKSGDKIFLTKETTLAKDTDKSVTLDAAATTSVEKEFTLAAKGNYTAYVNRGEDYIKQTTTAAVIEVGSSGFISLAFALILTVLLF